MKKYLVLLIIVVLFVTGCAREEAANGNEVPPATITYGKILTEEREAVIRDFVTTFEEMGMFKLYTMVENKNALEIWLDVGDEPITSDAVKGLTEGMVRDLADLFNGEVAIRLTALQNSAGNEVNRFGTSVYSPKTKEVTYEPL
jgi:PBP1b-binding outer membrane lipoprotein LpoB